MQVYPRYQAQLRSFQAFDFDDLICEVVRLWKRRPDVLERWRMRFRQVIVDEYQDTNHAQLELVRLLGGEHRNVCVVGDDDQSIYAWRGADVRNILDFEEHFSGAKVVKLQENYRSFKHVLDVANAVLAKSTARATRRRSSRRASAARRSASSSRPTPRSRRRSSPKRRSACSSKAASARATSPCSIDRTSSRSRSRPR